jgi:L-ascorbate metabolism protein UlaG (beta-lactamase superfamily)
MFNFVSVTRQSMTLTYIFHSGFALETHSAILVIDYWLDPADVIPKLLKSSKPMYVLSSHFHEDHFSRKIFAWKQEKRNITYILSKDILRHRRAERQDADVWMAKGAVWGDDNIKVHATGSNDSGVSWIIQIDGKFIFHAGDLNNWYARFLAEETPDQIIYSKETEEDINPVKEEKRFLGELKDIGKITSRFDIVMFPVDGRIGNGYTRGGRQFIDCFEVGLFVPMHFIVSGFKSAWRMKEFTDKRHIPFWSIKRNGEQIQTNTIINNI